MPHWAVEQIRVPIAPNQPNCDVHHCGDCFASAAEGPIKALHKEFVDAVIEHEIRACRFLIADLSDDNAGAYWEAGFAEGLGKPVRLQGKGRSRNKENPL